MLRISKNVFYMDIYECRQKKSAFGYLINSQNTIF